MELSFGSPPGIRAAWSVGKRERRKKTKNALWKTKSYHKIKLHFSVYYCYTAVKSKKSSVKKPVSPSRKQVQNGHKENLNTIEKILKSSSGKCVKHRKELFKLTSNCPHLRLIMATSDACSGATCCFTVTCIFLVLFHCSGSSYIFSRIQKQPSTWLFTLRYGFR